MRLAPLTTATLALVLLGCAGAPTARHAGTTAETTAEVTAAEIAFAESMANRDAAAFESFLATDTVFFSGESPTRGKAAVVASWKRFFTTKEPPFSWKPDQVQVLESGDLALSTGPVLDPRGQRIATFTSIWRREGPGVWRVVFDRGSVACPPRTP